MKSGWSIVAAVLIAVCLVVSAVIIRDGLLAVATQVHDKPMPKWPEELRIVAGDSKVNIDVAKMTVGKDTSAKETKISIGDIHITTPATQP